MFSKEVELADSMQTLFRGNSLASKIMTFCFKVCFFFKEGFIRREMGHDKERIFLLLQGGPHCM